MNLLILLVSLFAGYIVYKSIMYIATKVLKIKIYENEEVKG